MKILYLADPNLIHDIRWINIMQSKGNICYLLPRHQHDVQFRSRGKKLPPGIRLLDPISDPSTRRPLRDLLQALKVRRIVRTNKIDLIHIIYAEPNALWGNWKFLFKVPVVLTTLGTDVLVTIPSFFKKKDWMSRCVAWQYRRALNKFNVITCTSERQIRNLLTFNINVSLSLIRTGVDCRLVDSTDIDMASKIGLDKPFILMPRNMKPLYNHEFTLDAIGLLSRKVRDNFSFVFVNSCTENREYFKKICTKAERISADIRFFPTFSHPEIISLYKQASLVVMNPVSDGSPVSAMEAMACKTPVILPPLNYDNEIFHQCYFFEQWDPGALKNRIEEVLMMDRKDMEERLERASAAIEVNGDVREEIGKLERIYQSV